MLCDSYTTDRTYTFIAHKPASRRWEGCHCHGNYEHFDSDIQIDTELDKAALRAQFSQYLGRHLEDEEDGYEFAVLRNGRVVFSKGDHMPYADSDYDTEEAGEVERIYAEARAETDAKFAAELEAKKAKEAEAQKAKEERERKAAEEAERKQFEVLKAKFEK